MISSIAKLVHWAKRLRYVIVLTCIAGDLNNTFAQDNWKWQNPLPQGNTLNDLCMLDENIAVAVGYTGTIIKTSDSGITWNVMNSGTTERLYSVDFVNHRFSQFC